MSRKQTAEHVSEQGGETLGSSTDAWWTRAQVSKATGLSISGVRQREKRGEFITRKEVRGDQEVWLFDPSQFDNYDPDGEENAHASFISGASKALSVANELTKQSYDQQREIVTKCVGLVISFSENTNKTLAEIVGKQQTQVLELQQKNFEMRKQYEEALNEQHERATSRSMIEAEQRLKEKRWAEVSPVLAHIAKHFAEQKLGMTMPEPKSGPAPAATSTPTDVDTNPWRGLVLSITQEQAAALLPFAPPSFLETAAMLRDKFVRFTDETNLQLLCNDVEKILLELDGSQTSKLRTILSPLQTRYLETIEQIRREDP